MSLEKMPEKFKGEILTGGGYTITAPREWTAEEIEWMRDKRDEGFTIREIAEAMDRTVVSVSTKLKRISKKDDSYNFGHIEEKYAINFAFLDRIKPHSILDLYCGEKSFYKNNYRDADYIVTNDIVDEIEAEYHEDAFRLICKLYYEGWAFDLVDLDPFGSAYDCFDIAIKMARKGLVVTLGELGHKRWKRLDYVGTHYGIANLNDFTIDSLINEIKKIGLRNKKELIVVEQREWQNIGRVWFEIKNIKVTSQWEKKDANK